MAKESQMLIDPTVRVRGGRKGVRFIKLSDWKAEIKERKQSRIKRNDKLKEVRKPK